MIMLIGAAAVVLVVAALVLFLMLPALAMRDAQREDNRKPPL